MCRSALCGRLLLGADDVRVLATSREPLRIAGEVRCRLGPLTLPGPGDRLAFQAPRQGRPNTIVVGTGDNRLIKAQVTITARSGQTELRIKPGGITLDRLANTFGIAREIRKALAGSPSLSGHQAA